MVLRFGWARESLCAHTENTPHLTSGLICIFVCINSTDELIRLLQRNTWNRCFPVLRATCSLGHFPLVSSLHLLLCFSRSLWNSRRAHDLPMRRIIFIFRQRCQRFMTSLSICCFSGAFPIPIAVKTLRENPWKLLLRQIICCCAAGLHIAMRIGQLGQHKNLLSPTSSAPFQAATIPAFCRRRASSSAICSVVCLLSLLAIRHTVHAANSKATTMLDITR